MSFKRVAVINRGEPAVRLIRAVRELNAESEAADPIQTIALFTEPDRSSWFVHQADEALCLGPALQRDRAGRPRSAYLDLERLARALRSAGADAAWVGWGFVAEDPAFVELCDELGITFIGPPAAVMRRLGDKISAKQLAEESGFAVAPWSGGAVTTLEDAKRQAEDLGYPLLVKASAGGGGRGIRRVTGRDELGPAFERARAEALAAFGDDRVFLERQIASARHVEVQVAADDHGTVWTLGVRDCTVQRRRQKLLEESPPPTLTAAQVEDLRALADRLVRSAGYRNVGTVECLQRPEDGALLFMEVNARLQVEHPVTEITTGVDLVKLQLHLAAGGRLASAPPAPRGHAIEARLNAEDPDAAFAPAPGRLDLFELPAGPGLRVDSGFRAGDTVAPEFDAMLAKIIAHGSDREEALARLRCGLRQCSVVLRGGATNKTFLLELLSRPEVVEATADVGWLDREGAEPAADTPRPHAAVALMQAAIEAYEEDLEGHLAEFLAGAARGRPIVPEEVGARVKLSYRGQGYELVVRRLGFDRYRLGMDGRELDVRSVRRGPFEVVLSWRGQRHRILSAREGHVHSLEVEGFAHRVAHEDEGVLRASAPALVVSTHTAPGEAVARGDLLLVLEAMKVEIPIHAPFAGRVREVRAPNVQVAAGAPLVRLDPEPGAEARPLGRRLTFPAEEALSAPPDPFAELRAFLLGFDLPPADAARLAAELVARWEGLETETESAARDAQEAELLALFSAVAGLFGPDSDGVGQGELDVIRHLSRAGGRGAGLAPALERRLQEALALYGVEELAPSPRLNEALLRLHRARRSAAEAAGAMAALLGRRRAPPTGADEPLRARLDPLIAATHDRFPALNELARQLRFRRFDEPRDEALRRRVYDELRGVMARLAADVRWREREADLRRVTECPQPLLGFLSEWLEAPAQEVRELALELFIRRFYGPADPEEFRAHCGSQGTLLSAQARIGDRPTLVVVGYCSAPDAALRLRVPVAELLAARPGVERVVVDLITADPAGRLTGRSEGELAARIAAAHGAELPERVCLAVVDPARRATRDAYTFDRAEERAGLRHVSRYRGMHPMIGDRLALWRLEAFEAERLPSAEGVHLFRAVAREDPEDERLFAFIDVRDTTPLRDERGRIAHLPHLERLFTEAVIAMRDAQRRRAFKDRLLWNRILLYVRPAMRDPAAMLQDLIGRLAPLCHGLGLDKVVVCVRAPNPQTGVLEERSLHFAVDEGRVLRFRSAAPSDRPIRPLTGYARKVLKARRRGVTYPYEIVRMLTGGGRGLPPGEFQEYDLDGEGRLVPVDRPYGGNRANLVVGLVQNVTPRYPEGMRRVLLLGDPTRELGALAEPECRRVLAALDLAASLCLPLEWFPVSSGAKVSMESGTENLDWTARVLRRLVEFTEAGGVVDLVVDGINVGAQSYWNAEATMLMHTRGALIMTSRGSMVLTGKRALDYSGAVSADSNQEIGGLEAIMKLNGQAQYAARDLAEALELLFRYRELTYVAPGEQVPRRFPSPDPVARDISDLPYPGDDFARVGDVFSAEHNPDRKRPFDIRAILGAVADAGHAPLERWAGMRDAETAVVWDATLGGWPVCLLGIESRAVERKGSVPGDGPEAWTGGTLFPLSSKKMARAIRAAGLRPVVILANLSGFDGSPESMRRLQLEYGAELGRAVVKATGPVVLCVISRYHGGAYVVFSRTLNERLEVVALEGSYASVIGGAPAAAVVFPRLVRERTLADPRVVAAQAQVAAAPAGEHPAAREQLEALLRSVESEKLSEVASEFDGVHSVRRALDVGSLHAIVDPRRLRPALIDAVARGMGRCELAAAELDCAPPAKGS